MAERIRLGIVGCGGGTRVMYVPVLRYVEDFRVTALCDSDPAALERTASLLGFEGSLHTDYREMLARAPVDALIIATPVFLHRQQVVEAAAAGKHVLCEKPMARTVAECDDMIGACDAAAVTLAVGFMKRFDKSMLCAKQLIDEGRLGPVHQLICDWRGGAFARHLRAPHHFWRGRLQTWGGIYQDHGSHTSDLSRWWLGEITSVTAQCDIFGEGWEVENSAVATYRHAGGATSLHLVGVGNKPLGERYEFDGDRAALEMSYGPGWSFASPEPFRMTLFEDGGRRRTDVAPRNLGVLDEELAASGRYKRELDHFGECIRTGRPALNSGEAGRKAIEAINAVYLSSYLQETVRLPLQQPVDLPEIFRAMQARSV